MGPFPWLFRMTAEGLWPFYAVAAASLVAIAVRRHRSPVTEERPPLRLLFGILAAPLALTVWASLNYGVDGYGAGGWGLASAVLLALAVGTLGGVGYTVWRWRWSWLAALPAAVAATAATLLAWFIGAMAIADDWI